MDNQKTIVIYHANCADGFGAAYAAWKALGDGCEYHPGVYQDDPPDVTDKRVFILDFSYPGQVLRDMADQAHSVTILDHHKTAKADLKLLLQRGDILGEFDMARSGAMMAWQYFHPTAARPPLIDYIQDRDLWAFKLPFSREVSAALFSHPYDFDVWDGLMNDWSINDLIKDGLAIERKHWRDIRELMGNAVYQEIGGHRVPMINCPYIYASDMGHMLAEDHPFAACWWETPEGRVFSLRSRDDGVDVSEIAQLFGGGGHEHAAGFRIPHEQIPTFMRGEAEV